MLAPLLCLALTLSEPASAELVRRTYDLRTILPRASGELVPIAALPLRQMPSQELDMEFEGEYEFPCDLLLDLMLQTVAPEEWEYAGRGADLRENDILMVEAPPEVQQEVERFLEFVGRATRPRIAVRVDVFRSGRTRDSADLAVGNLDQAGVDRLRKLVDSGVLTPVDTLHFDLLSGLPQTRVAAGYHSFLRDFDLEIAQASAIHSPIIETYPLGVVASVRADRDTQGRVLLSYALRDSWSAGATQDIDVRADHRISTDKGVEPILSGGVLQSPRVSFATMAGSVRLSAGGTATSMAASLGTEGVGPGTVVAFTLEKLDPIPEDFVSGERYLSIRDVGGNLSRGYQAHRFGRIALTSAARNPDSDDEQRLPGTIGVGPINGDDLSLVDDIIGRLLDDSDGEISAGQAANFVYVFGSKRYVSGWMERLIGSLPLGGGAPALLSSLAGAEASEQGAAPLFCLSADVGDALAVCGTQRTMVTNYEVEVANNVSVAEPIVEAPVDGWAARMHTARNLADQHEARFYLLTHLGILQRKAHEHQAQGLGVLQMVSFGEGLVEAWIDLTADRGRDVGVVPLPNGRRGRILVTTTR